MRRGRSAAGLKLSRSASRASVRSSITEEPAPRRFFRERNLALRATQRRISTPAHEDARGKRSVSRTRRKSPWYFTTGSREAVRSRGRAGLQRLVGRPGFEMERRAGAASGNLKAAGRDETEASMLAASGGRLLQWLVGRPRVRHLRGKNAHASSLGTQELELVPVGIKHSNANQAWA